ncbi:hypothetical protein D3C71_1781570 [compost metagenome]
MLCTIIGKALPLALIQNAEQLAARLMPTRIVIADTSITSAVRTVPMFQSICTCASDMAMIEPPIRMLPIPFIPMPVQKI